MNNKTNSSFLIITYTVKDIPQEISKYKFQVFTYILKKIINIFFKKFFIIFILNIFIYMSYS